MDEAAVNDRAAGRRGRLHHLELWLDGATSVDGRHPFAGGPDHYAAYLENTAGLEVELVAEPQRGGGNRLEFLEPVDGGLVRIPADRQGG